MKLKLLSNSKLEDFSYIKHFSNEKELIDYLNVETSRLIAYSKITLVTNKKLVYTENLRKIFNIPKISILQLLKLITIINKSDQFVTAKINREQKIINRNLCIFNQDIDLYCNVKSGLYIRLPRSYTKYYCFKFFNRYIKTSSINNNELVELHYEINKAILKENSLRLLMVENIKLDSSLNKDEINNIINDELRKIDIDNENNSIEIVELKKTCIFKERFNNGLYYAEENEISLDENEFSKYPYNPIIIIPDYSGKLKMTDRIELINIYGRLLCDSKINYEEYDFVKQSETPRHLYVSFFYGNIDLLKNSIKLENLIRNLERNNNLIFSIESGGFIEDSISCTTNRKNNDIIYKKYTTNIYFLEKHNEIYKLCIIKIHDTSYF